MKVVLVGDTQVGKTCMLNRLTTGSFKESHSATVGAAFQTHSMSTLKGFVTMQIWDTAGQEKYRALAPMYYRSANVAIVCFDITNRDSFKAAGLWADELAQKAPGDLKTVFVGTKCDLSEARQVSFQEAESFALEKGAQKYFECSSKTGKGVVDVFIFAAELVEGAAMKRPDVTLVAQEPNKPAEKKCC